MKMNGVFGDFSYGSYSSFFASSSLFLIDIFPGESGDWRDGMELWKRSEMRGKRVLCFADQDGVRINRSRLREVFSWPHHLLLRPDTAWSNFSAGPTNFFFVLKVMVALRRVSVHGKRICVNRWLV
jgi:hypothetical protein